MHRVMIEPSTAVKPCAAEIERRWPVLLPEQFGIEEEHGQRIATLTMVPPIPERATVRVGSLRDREGRFRFTVEYTAAGCGLVGFSVPDSQTCWLMASTRKIRLLGKGGIHLADVTPGVLWGVLAARFCLYVNREALNQQMGRYPEDPRWGDVWDYRDEIEEARERR